MQNKGGLTITLSSHTLYPALYGFAFIDRFILNLHSQEVVKILDDPSRKLAGGCTLC
jgi:hypothetical protein